MNVSNNDTLSAADPPPASGLLGILICTVDGQIIWAQGIAKQPAVQEAVVALTHAQERRKVFALDGSPPCIAVVLVHEQTRVVVLRAADKRSEDLLFDFVATVPFSAAVLNHFLTNSYDAVSVADAQGVLRFISPTHERWLGLRPGEALGRPAAEILPNSRMSEVVESGKAEIGYPYSPDGVSTRIVSRIPIFQDGKVVGVLGHTLIKGKGPEVVGRMHREVSRLQSEVLRYKNQLHQLRQEPAAVGRLIGDSAPMQRLRQEIQQAAQFDVPVLILGESGVGKELVAKALHELSPRRTHPLVNLNLTALPASLLEAELFGYAPGTFTGSLKAGRSGKFESADAGTVFLDEVGDIPGDFQVKLLRVLEDRVVERLGEHRPRQIDFRLISATHRNMDQLVSTGQFRLDLFYRLAGVTLHVPSLRERVQDVLPLARHFMQQFCQRNNWPLPEMEHEVAPYLAQQPWPGNVRQLRQRIEEALVFSAGKRLSLAHFERNSAGPPTSAPSRHADPAPFSARAPSPPRLLKELEQDAAKQALAFFAGNKKQAAKALGVSRSHLYKLLDPKPPPFPEPTTK